MRLELSPDQAAWQSTAASFAQEHVAPAAALIDESGEFPSALVADATNPLGTFRMPKL